MTAQDAFDRRLGAALLAYAADAALEPDPMGFAADLAARHPRSRRSQLAGRLGRTRLRPLWIAIALVLLAAAAGVALVGMHSPQDPLRLTVVGTPVPDGLYGRWVREGSSTPYLDLNSTALIHAAGGPLDQLGSVVGFIAAGPDAAEGRLLIHASLPCGDASYQLVAGDGPATGPTAAPVPSAEEPPRAVNVDSIRLLDGVDSCAERRSLLSGASWTRLKVPLAAGGTYESLDFPEPFHVTLPVDVALGLPNGWPAGYMYETHADQLRISHPWWGGAFVDDVPVYRDLCDRDLGMLPDIPGSVDAVVAWLRSTTSIGFDAPTELVVDGRRSVRLQARGECGKDGPAASDLTFGGEYYVIPTRDDVILFVLYADTANESKVAERIVLALRFD